MKQLACALAGVAASILVAAEESCIIEDNSVDEKYVATASAAGFDIVGVSTATKGAAMDLRSCTKDYSSPVTVDTDAPGLYLIVR